MTGYVQLTAWMGIYLTDIELVRVKKNRKEFPDDDTELVPKHVGMWTTVYELASTIYSVKWQTGSMQTQLANRVISAQCTVVWS